MAGETAYSRICSNYLLQVGWQVMLILFPMNG